MSQLSVVGMFCEDIREEMSGQDMLIGILPDNLDVPTFPGAMPKLGFYVRFHMDPAVDPGPLALRIRMPDGTERAHAVIDPTVVSKTRADAQASGSPIAGLITKTIIAPFRIDGPGRILLIVTQGGAEQVCALLNVQGSKVKPTPNPASP